MRDSHCERQIETEKAIEFIMKTRITAVLRALALLALLSTTNLASAYYDPGVQRWINRDPIGEKGGIVLYVFANNDPEDHVDAFGQISVTYKCRTGRSYIGLGGCMYTCVVSGTLGGQQLAWLAVNAKKFAICASQAAGAMNLGCFFEVYQIFAAGCEKLKSCFEQYTTPIGIGGTEPPIF